MDLHCRADRTRQAQASNSTAVLPQNCHRGWVATPLDVLPQAHAVLLGAALDGLERHPQRIRLQHAAAKQHCRMRERRRTGRLVVARMQAGAGIDALALPAPSRTLAVLPPARLSAMFSRACGFNRELTPCSTEAPQPTQNTQAADTRA